METAGARFIGIVIAHRGFVRLQVAARAQLGEHALVDRLAPLGGDPDPVDHRLAAEWRAPALRHLLEAIKRQMVLIFGDRDPGEQPGRGVAAGHGPGRRRRDHRRQGAILLAAIFPTHELALEEGGRHDIDFKGAFFADLLEGRRLRQHFGGLDHDGFLHRQPGEGLRRHRAFLRRGLGAFVADGLGFRRRRGQLRQFGECELQLRGIDCGEFLALAAAEQLAFEPRDLLQQHGDTLLQTADLLRQAPDARFEGEVFGIEFGGGRHGQLSIQ